MPADCPLCAADGGDLVWRSRDLRVVLPDEPGFPGFTRVIWHGHCAEMTELAADERELLMAVVWRVEQVQREVLRPDKVNLASLGNVVAHLHWHVIPRWRDDSHFPAPVWAAPARDGMARRIRAGEELPRYRAALAARLGAASDA